MAVLGLRLRLLLAIPALALSLSPAFAVFGGKSVDAGESLGRAVAAVLSETADGAQLCTAVMLGPQLLLTAAHCVAGDRSKIRLIFSTTLAGVAPDRIRGADAVVKAKTTGASKGLYPYQNPDDIALVRLDAAAPEETVFASLGEIGVNTSLRFAGYGATSELRKPDADGKRQFGFDKLLRTAAVPLISLDEALLVGDQTQGAGACTGDSGGPAFSADGHLVGLLIGVSSTRDTPDYCRGKAYFANLDRWTAWIETTADSLGQPLH